MPLPAAAALSRLRTTFAERFPSCVEWLRAQDNFLLVPGDDAYPARLAEITDPPLLFARGDPSVLQRPSIAMVGSRTCTPQGARDAEAFARAFGEAGFTIVSGMARGIDGASHEGALGTPGSTIAVMGTGFGVTYPKRHAALQARIEAEGCVVTEFSPGFPPLPANFPQRNRIISGLALGVVVVEADIESGSLITARFAAEQSRDVYAMPGSIHSPQSRGCHKLLRDGAGLVETVADVLRTLAHGQFAKGVPDPQPSRGEPAETGEAGRVLTAMGYAAASVDEIARSSGLAVPQVLAQLTLLELASRVEAVAGGRFQRRTGSPGGAVIK